MWEETGVFDSNSSTRTGSNRRRVVVKQATLHNFDYIREKRYSHRDKVLVKRAGDVIPYVIGPIIALRRWSGKKYFRIPSMPRFVLQPVEHYRR